MTQIAAYLIPDEDSDRDDENHTGLTTEAYERLVDALNGAGFSVADMEVIA